MSKCKAILTLLLGALCLLVFACDLWDEDWEGDCW